MGVLKLILPLPPSVNTYQQYRVRRFGRKMRVEAYPKEDTEAFYSTSIKYIIEEIKAQDWEVPPLGEYLLVEATMYLERAGSDADNFLKCTLDSLEKSGVVENDTYIIPRVLDVFIDKDRPRVELTITHSPKIGVFKNSEELENFKQTNCKLCTRRNKTKCVVFRGMLENRSHHLDKEGNCTEKKSF